MEGEGFEPSKAEPSDLQSDPFGHSGTPPHITFCYYFFVTQYNTMNLASVVTLTTTILSTRDKDGGGRRIRTFEG